MERVYNLVGTPEELSIVFQNEFKMSKALSTFYVSLLLTDSENPSSVDDDDELSLWYVQNQTGNKYQTPLLQSRYSISFTILGKEAAETLFIYFAQLLDGNDKQTFSTILLCLKALYRSGTHIKDSECCAYYRALQWRAVHSSKEYFTAQDIMPKDNEGNCVFLDKISEDKWKCNDCHGDVCTMNISKFNDILSALADRHVFVKYNNMYRFEV